MKQFPRMLYLNGDRTAKYAIANTQEEEDALRAKDYAFLRDAKPVADPEAEADKPLLAILEGTVPEVVTMLDALTDEELVRLAELEAEDKDRATVADAIAALQAKRAAG